jgi:class 3 adenylate cyclase
MSQLPTGPVTLLFTDIEVYTLLLQQLGEHLASVLIEYRDLLRTACSEYHGYEFDTQGDGCFGVFGRSRVGIQGVTVQEKSAHLICTLSFSLGAGTATWSHCSWLR